MTDFRRGIAKFSPISARSAVLGIFDRRARFHVQIAIKCKISLPHIKFDAERSHSILSVGSLKQATSFLQCDGSYRLSVLSDPAAHKADTAATSGGQSAYLEEDITWSIGTVKQVKQAIESKVSEHLSQGCGTPSDPG